MLHQHFKTPSKGGAIRSYYLAKALAGKGHRVVMITSTNEEEYAVENLEGIEVHYLPVAYDNRFRFYQRAWAFMKFVWKACRLAGQFKDFDKCYAISAPLTVGIIARWIWLRYTIPYIFEVGDLWPDAPVQLGFVKNSLFKKVLYALEKSTYKRAQSVVALSPAIQSAVALKVPGKKIYLIPNMADCEFYRPTSKDPELERKYGVAGKIVVSYVGAIGVANGLEYFLDCAAASMKRDLPIYFILCGDGAMVESLKAKASTLRLNNLLFNGFVERNGVKELLNVTDAAFICYKNVPVLETGSPNKFFDGLAAGKLIVINFGGWLKNEIAENSCGFVLDPRDPADFVKQFEPLVDDPERLRRYQASARSLAERKYSRHQLGEEFAKLFA
jgi:glycosyltransferase involved in cell wall biosynthesis